MNMNVNTQRPKYMASLKTLANGPKRIAEANAKYDAAKSLFDDPISQRNYSPAFIDRHKAKAKAELDETIKRTVTEMRSALDFVKQEHGNSAPFDPNDRRIQNAIAVVNAVGKQLDYSQQLDLIEGFRGDVQGLKFISTLLKKNGMEYSADTAMRMARDVSTQALEDMDYSISKYEMLGQWDAEPIRWTQSEFAKTLERFGESADTDPYYYALADLKRTRRDDAEAQKVLGEALTIMKQQQEEGNADSSIMAGIYNDAVSKLEADN